MIIMDQSCFKCLYLRIDAKIIAIDFATNLEAFKTMNHDAKNKKHFMFASTDSIIKRMKHLVHSNFINLLVIIVEGF